MRQKRPGWRRTAKGEEHRTWTACVTAEGYARMAATPSERDEHDDQIMQAAHDAVRLMGSSGAESGRIDLLPNTEVWVTNGSSGAW
jgi:hypothetical protein